MVPLPVAPATGWTMSTPWSRNVLASCSPLAGSPQGLSPPTKVPVCLAASQPRSLTSGAVLLVVDLGAGVHAVHEPGHARELLAAVGAEDLALAEAGGEVARERRRLVDLEVQAGEVGGRRAVGGLVPRGVDLGERDVGVRLGRVDRRLGLVEPDRDDRLAALVDEGLDVVRVVRGALRLAEGGLVAKRLRVVQALLGEVVEALVTKTARVEGDARLPVGVERLGRGRAGGLGRCLGRRRRDGRGRLGDGGLRRRGGRGPCARTGRDHDG